MSEAAKKFRIKLHVKTEYPMSIGFLLVDDRKLHVI